MRRGDGAGARPRRKPAFLRVEQKKRNDCVRTPACRHQIPMPRRDDRSSLDGRAALGRVRLRTPRRAPTSSEAPSTNTPRTGRDADAIVLGQRHQRTQCVEPSPAPPSRLVRFRRVPETARGADPRNARFGAPLPRGRPRAPRSRRPASPNAPSPRPVARGDSSRRDLTPTPRPPPPRALLRSSSHHHHLSARPSHVIRVGPNSFIHIHSFLSALWESVRDVLERDDRGHVALRRRPPRPRRLTPPRPRRL